MNSKKFDKEKSAKEAAYSNTDIDTRNPTTEYNEFMDYLKNSFSLTSGYVIWLGILISLGFGLDLGNY